jgi:hypothetical protein
VKRVGRLKNTNPFRKSSRTGRCPSRREEGNKSKEMDKEMKTMMRGYGGNKRGRTKY